MKKVTMTINGEPFSIETGRMAKQADGAVLVSMGDTVVLVTAVADRAVSPKDFFPLFVEYREKLYAAGRIPGGFFKREGRQTEKETLNSRLIDRPLRPLFDENFKYETQLAAQVLSFDAENQPDVLSITGASAALALSNIPFPEFVSGVRVGRIDGRFVVNPKLSEIEKSDIDIVVAGTDAAVIMVEGEAKEVGEEDLLQAIMFGHGHIRDLNRLQRELAESVGVPKQRTAIPQNVVEELDRSIEETYFPRIKNGLQIVGKMERQDHFNAIRDEALERYKEQYPEHEAYIMGVLEKLEKREMRRMILEDKVRVDRRGPADIRPITCEVGVLPRAHGSALFTRGETQSLAATTLGTTQDEQMLDTIEGESWKRYMLHYNFPPFSVGEVGAFRGPGRREIGHGALAERAIKPLIPNEQEFPYTIRIVSDILESNGSSSMATVCAGSLALMDAGVPVSKAVAGIAMGLVLEGGSFRVLSDILGLEDHLGDMDFKVTGTRTGITAFQMDVKVAGVTEDILRQALAQAKNGREHILSIMDTALSRPRAEISPFAPKITMIQIPVDKIRDVIGPGGKVIRSIQEESGATIEVDDDGTIKVAAVNKASSDIAIKRIRDITADPEVGAVYEGVVKSIVNFGAFVEILPGRDGLLHISEISRHRVNKVEDELNLGDVIKVKVININGDGKIRLSKKALDGSQQDSGRS
jgi:polyribonucleotide nucleotidyltransferase